METQSIEGRYNIIYADPAWSYRDKCHSGERGVNYKYQTMTIDEVMTMEVEGKRVREIAAKDAALLLWVPPALTVEALGPVMGAWGFKFNTKAFCWYKLTKHGKEHFGMGSKTRANSEDCWLGLRGKLKRQSAAVRQIVKEAETCRDLYEDEVIDSPVREHSRKPDEVRNRTVELFGDVPRIELFAREVFPGWAAWGDGVDLSLGVVGTR